MIQFDTSVQELKYHVLKEIAKLAFEDNLNSEIMKVPEKIIPGPNPSMRCCIYKERAIVGERIRMAMGGDKSNENVVEVMNIACDECPVTQFTVGPACRGCIAHRCVNNCPKGAIHVITENGHVQKAIIDTDKCVECGRCQSVCPYNAIIHSERPCEHACKVGAIKMDENKKAKIDNDKCISCGACVYQCPFGAIMDKSYMLDAIKILKESENNTKYNVYAVVAPSISSQLQKVKLGQVIAGIKELGFHSVVEAALGADMIAYKEAKELSEKGFLTSSCCPAFVAHTKKHFPDMEEHISHNLSPMTEIAKYLKKMHPDSKVVFIGPCIAKKAEFQLESVSPYIDCVLTFEEMLAMFDSKNIDLASLPEEVLDNASYFGRIFARSGGLADAVKEGLKEHGISEDEFEYNPVSCSGIDECKTALLKAQKGVLKENFIEGMACEDGCIGGAACITHGPKDRKQVDAYGKEALEKGILDSIGILRFIDPD